MEMLEKVDANTVAGKDIKSRCPFDCEKKKCETSCDFEGIKFPDALVNGFPDNLRQGQSTIRFRVSGVCIKGEDRKIASNKEPEDKDILPNIFGWGAHHLIPLGAIKEHPIRSYMDKSYMHNGADRAEVICDGGYDINGAENGVWLVATYRGMQKEIKNDERFSRYVERTLERAGITFGRYSNKLYSAMTAAARESDPMSKQWFNKKLSATMWCYQRQFHDSHREYDDFVKGVLDKVFTNAERLGDDCFDGEKCPAESKEKRRAPHIISYRLNAISGRLRQYLCGNGIGWKEPLLTSELSRKHALKIKTRKS